MVVLAGRRRAVNAPWREGIRPRGGRRRTGRAGVGRCGRPDGIGTPFITIYCFFTSARNLANFRLFTNEFDTRTPAVDLVASLSPPWVHQTVLTLALNHPTTRVTRYNPAVLDDGRIHQL